MSAPESQLQVKVADLAPFVVGDAFANIVQFPEADKSFVLQLSVEIVNSDALAPLKLAAEQLSAKTRPVFDTV